MLDTHVLKVTAYERLEPFVSASTTVIVDVLDVQDNAPIFEINSYFAEVREDAPVSTVSADFFCILFIANKRSLWKAYSQISSLRYNPCRKLAFMTLQY